MPEIKSYEKVSSETSNLVTGLVVGIILSVVGVFLLGLFTL
jgi:capsular polysaccharide biosynthesis protein